MSFRNNGRKRDPKLLFGSIFIFIIGLLLLLITSRGGWQRSWTIISLAVLALSVMMFKNSNEL